MLQTNTKVWCTFTFGDSTAYMVDKAPKIPAVNNCFAKYELIRA